MKLKEDTSRFRGGDRSDIRVARVLLENVNLIHSDVRWFVFRDNDTVFTAENLVKTLSRYDHNLWYYIGSISETFIQNDNDLSSFEMGVWWRWFCRKLFTRKSSSQGELGVALAHEIGFHPIDLRDDIFGLLASHPLAPLISLHHLDNADPIFPKKTRHQAVEHLLKAAAFDPYRIVQQTICYDTKFSRTISISWGHAVQVFESNVLVRDLLQVRKMFKLWRKREIPYWNLYMFNTREVDSDPCKRPTIFFLDSLSSTSNTEDIVITSIYKSALT